MATLADVKYIGGANSNANVWSNDEQWIKVVYNFATDTGAQAALDALVNGSSSKKYAITDFMAFVETAVTSGGSPTVSLGNGSGKEIWADVAKATLAINKLLGVSGSSTALPVVLLGSEKLVFTIATADLTAGKIHMFLKVKQLVY